MNKDPLFFLRHILESISNIESFTKKFSKAKFLKNVLVQSAVVRHLEIIGEAVKNLPIDFVNKYPQMPWGEIAGTRDKLAHHYYGVDLDYVYDIIKKDLPKLKIQIKQIIIELEGFSK